MDPAAMPRRSQRRFGRAKSQNLVARMRVGDRTVRAPVEDISLGGMLARTTEAIDPGVVVMFELERPAGGRRLPVLGVVLGERAGLGLGVRFDGLTEDTVEGIADLVRAFGGNDALLGDPVSEPALEAPTTLQHHLEERPAPRALPPAPSELERLQAQLRVMVQEIGTLQEQLAQRDNALASVTAERDRARAQAQALSAELFELKNENEQIEEQLMRIHERNERELHAYRQEASASAAALRRMIESLERLPSAAHE